MISKYDIIKSFEKAAKEGKKTELQLDEKKENIINVETGEELCTVETYTQFMREKLHCDFECVYYEHVSLLDVIRCKQCGTVIFAREDEDYDPNLRCPTCGDYKTHFDYWTKEEIERDVSKRAEIEALEKMQADMEEEAIRRERRKGKYDWEIWKKKWYGKKHSFNISLECCNLFDTGLKGLNLHIMKFSRKDKDDMSYTSDWFKRIPLSPYAFYIQCIVPRTKKYKEAEKRLHSQMKG